MAAEQQEQNRTEEPTPFKLKRARERGMVPRSIELGFLGGLVGLLAFTGIAGHRVAHELSEMMRNMLAGGIGAGTSPERAQGLIAAVAWPLFQSIALLGGTILAIVLLLEIVQLRGLIFTAQPLKPDFTRLNPANGIKRIFSLRMLKETLKSVAKATVYAIAAWLVLRFCIAHDAPVIGDTSRMPETMEAAAMRLLLVFILIAAGFVAIDQLLVRREFLKQMRMSRRELTRESREREGEPRIKSKRKQLHAEMAKAVKGAGALTGSDMLIVNPEHFAVALRYDEARMAAPQVTTKGRNAFALALKDEAFRRGIPIIARPALARALYRAATIGREIPPGQYEPIAELYLQLHREKQAQQS